MIPLAEQLRPQTLEDIVGQDHLLEIIQQSIDAKKPLSMILWGPPGCGKTSLARLYAKAFALPFHNMSAIFSGINDLKLIIKKAQDTPVFHKNTVLFVDEIHRFNKSQQDAFLPFIEDGTITLIGATAENPSFYLNNALLSRARVLTLNPLNTKHLNKLITRYEEKFPTIKITEEDKKELIKCSQGDGRYLFNLIESFQPGQKIARKAALFDRGGDQHYNLISALHKSIRGSDPDAALYWFSRMLEGGEEPLFLARRLIRMASEDIGLADPQALPLTIAARDAYQMLGSPEGELALAEAVIYLALAPKSNATYTAYKQARAEAAKTTQLSPPSIILNAPTKTMKDLGYGKGYLYDHEQKNAFSGQNYFPDEMERVNLYQPVDRGFEREMKKRQDYFNKRRKS